MIEVKDIVKKFGNTAALDGLSFTVPDGGIYGIVGSNGAGKSTLLRVMCGIYKPDRGQVLYDGKNVWEDPAVKSRFAFVPDEPFFDGGVSLKRMALTYGSLFPRFDARLCADLAGDLGLDMKKPISTYSKGMKRQAAVILAVASRPEYYVFDETFDGLDPVMRYRVKTIVSADTAERGATAVLTSHSLRELEDVCDHLAMLHRGTLVLDSDVGSLKTSLFKIQIAYKDDYGADRFSGIDVIDLEKRGSVTNMIVRGDRDAVSAKLYATEPILCEILPLSLEEVFTYELDALGYGQRTEEER
ncbi:MAG: ABC transporter ATP-binding protein [Clostridia bacterium]|nr:ABC transporter ATP-binding protein [Clostridia bacterium]